MDFHQTWYVHWYCEGLVCDCWWANFVKFWLLSARDMPIFSFLADNLCKCQGILTKLGTCIDIKEIWFGIANGQISSMFDRVMCPRHNMVGYYSLTFLFLFLHENMLWVLIRITWTRRGWSGGAKVLCILDHRGVQLILAYSWARPAILVVGKGRGGMFLFLLFLHFHSCSSFFPVPLFHLLYSLFYLFSPFLWETTQNDPQGLTCR